MHTLWYTSWRELCAPSDAEPIARASHCTKVPDGSMWYLNSKRKNNYLAVQMYFNVFIFNCTCYVWKVNFTYSWGPFSSTPPNRSATPNGRLWIDDSAEGQSRGRKIQKHILNILKHIKLPAFQKHFHALEIWMTVMLDSLTIAPGSASSSPNCRARLDTAWVTLSTVIVSL